MKFSTMKNLAIAAIAIISLAGCGGGGGGLSKEFPNVNETGSVSGRLMAPSAGSRTLNQSITLVPLSDAVVTCSGRKDTTDSNGEFEVTLVPVGIGIKCTAVKSGYNLIEFTVDVTKGKTTELSADIPVYEEGDFLVTTSVTLTSGSTSDSYPVSCDVVGGRADSIAIACDSVLDATTVATNANSGSKNCSYTVAGTYTPSCTVNSSVSDDSDQTITVTGSSSVSVVASINPTTGTINEFYLLTCAVTGTKMISLEGRCSSTGNWTLITSGSTMNCQYSAAGTYTPSCRVDESVVDNADVPVVITNASLSVSSSIAPSSSMTYTSYTVKCAASSTPTSLEGKCDEDDLTWELLDTGSTLTMNCGFDTVCTSYASKDVCNAASACHWNGTSCADTYNPVCRLNGSDTTTVIPEISALTTIDSYVVTCVANGTPVSMAGKCDENDASWTTLTAADRTATLDCVYTTTGSKAPVCQVNGSAVSSTEYTLLLADPIKPKVLLFLPAKNATNVPDDAPSFSVIFSVENNGSMDSTIDLNTQATLTASGFSITLQRNDTGSSLTIDATNALSYGTFSWVRTFSDNDTLKYTLKTNAQLASAGLKTIGSGIKYNITAFTIPSNLTDARGVALDTSKNIPTSGSFTTIITDKTAPQVSSFVPADGATNVNYDGPIFSVIFNETMDSTIDLNNSTTLTASGFSISLQRNDTGASLTIDSTNALNYGTFSWVTTSSSNDTLSYSVFADSVLETNGLTRFATGTQYNITSRTVPTNLTDSSGNALDTVTNIPSTGSFTTIIPDLVDPQVSSFLPIDGATNVTSDGPVFSVVFTESMDSSIDFNNSTTLTASGFSITLQKNDTGATLVVDSTNALNYGSFAWDMTSVTDDTLAFTVFSDATLMGNGLFRFATGSQYNITARTVPTNLTDVAGNPLDMVTNVPATGTFTTLP